MTARIIQLDAGRTRRRAAERTRPDGTVLARFFAALAEADARFRERSYLAEMDDRMLRDIGVTRAEAEAESRRLISWRSLLPHG